MEYRLHQTTFLEVIPRSHFGSRPIVQRQRTFIGYYKYIESANIGYRITSQPRGLLLSAYLLHLNLQSALIEAIITTGKVLVLSLQQGSRLLFSMTSLCSSAWSKKRTIFTSEVIQTDEVALPTLNPWTPAWPTTAFCQFSVSLLPCY